MENLLLGFKSDKKNKKIVKFKENQFVLLIF